MADLITVADSHGIIVRQAKGSHGYFTKENWRLSVPARRPIKPIYIRKFVDGVGKGEKP